MSIHTYKMNSETVVASRQLIVNIRAKNDTRLSILADRLEEIISNSDFVDTDELKSVITEIFNRLNELGYIPSIAEMRREDIHREEMRKLLIKSYRIGINLIRMATSPLVLNWLLSIFEIEHRINPLVCMAGWIFIHSAVVKPINPFFWLESHESEEFSTKNISRNIYDSLKRVVMILLAPIVLNWAMFETIGVSFGYLTTLKITLALAWLL